MTNVQTQVSRPYIKIFVMAHPLCNGFHFFPSFFRFPLDKKENSFESVSVLSLTGKLMSALIRPQGESRHLLTQL